MYTVEVGDEAPDFKANTQIGEISFHDYITGGWTIFFSHPSDFTPVCTTEFGMLAKLQDEYDARNCKIIGLSIDSVASHEAWIRDVNETQDTKVTFPVIADEGAKVADLFGMAKKTKAGKNIITNRTLLIIDPQRQVQLRMTYPSNTGRNFYEVIRVLDSLQLTEYHQVGTPANWKNGEDVVVLADVTDEAAKVAFPKGFTTIKPYLRITPMPDFAESKQLGEEDDEDEKEM